jgi:predicted transcriptional regulator
MATIVINTTPFVGHRQITVSDLYYHVRNSGKRGAYRDLVDICVAVLKNMVRHSKRSLICRASNIPSRYWHRYLSILYSFGLISQITSTNKVKNNPKQHYYLTPKGYALIRVYDAMTELLTTFLH